MLYDLIFFFCSQNGPLGNKVKQYDSCLSSTEGSKEYSVSQHLQVLHECTFNNRIIELIFCLLEIFLNRFLWLQLNPDNTMGLLV